jgi:glycerophosphoryl diester phosphodiesterase
MKAARRAGVPVHVWTINDADEMNRLLDLGVDGLMTDRTELLKEVFESRGLWSS